MWEIKLIKFVPATQGREGDSFLYSLVGSRETGEITANLRNLRTFRSEEEAKTYLGREFHGNLVLIETCKPEGHDGISIIRYVPATERPDGNIHTYSLVREAEGVNARLENLQSFKSEDEAAHYLKSEFHADLVMVIIVDWRPLSDE